MDAAGIAWLEQMSAAEIKLLRQIWQRGINAPVTSSCGRLFDAVAALCGLRLEVGYEGQAALELEMAITPGSVEPYPFPVVADEEVLLLDWQPMLAAIMADLAGQVPVGVISRRFHDGQAHGVLEVCRLLRKRTGLDLVVLSGGVFQNRYLTEAVSDLLVAEGFDLRRHSLVPPNDGGLALGQAEVAAAGL